MELQVGVKVLLQNRGGKFLFLKRSAEKYPDVSDPWDCVGGRIDTGKTLFENLKREVKEEISVDLEEEPKLIAAQDIMVPHKNRHVVRLTYMGICNEDPVLDDDHDEYQWLSKEEALALGDKLDKYVRNVFEIGLI